MNKRFSFTLSPLLMVCIFVAVFGTVEYFNKEPAVPQKSIEADYTERIEIDESFQNHQFSEDMRDEIRGFNKHQRMRIHGTSHSRQTDNLCRKYNALYGL